MHYQGVIPVLSIHPHRPFKGFKACALDRDVTATISCHRRDLYKLCLITAKSKLCYQEEEIDIEGSVLFYASPHATYSWEIHSQEQSGYSCFFTEEFLGRHPYLTSFLQSPLLGLGDVAVFPLTQRQKEDIAAIFGQLLSAQDSGYVFKHELIGSCLHLLTHEALKKLLMERGNS
jgi:hypothetical protein